MNKITIIVAFFALVFFGGQCALAQSGYNLFQKGLVQERVKGDLDEAIKIYERIIVKFPRNRPIVAKALLHIGLCYEKLGKQEAQKAYQRLIEEYAEQHDVVAQARMRLVALEQDNGKSEVTVRKVWGQWGSPSPDGRYLAFANWGYGDLAVHDLVTGEGREITDGGKDWNTRVYFAESTPVWSPDGKQIAYGWLSEHPNDKPHELCIIGLDGSEPRVLYRDENKEVTSINVHDWSRDGRFILAGFLKKVGTSERSVSEIALVSVADGSVRTLKSIEPPVGRPSFQVSRSLSPDGSYVVYARSVKENDGLRDIFLLATDGSNEEIPLVEHLADDFAPVWAPDGKTIVFCSDRSATYDAWLMQVADGKPVGNPQLAKSGTGMMLPMGFTREDALYYVVQRYTIGTIYSWYLGDIYVASIDPAKGKLLGRPTKAIQQFEGFNCLPAWSPDGKSLAYISGRSSPGRARRKPALVIRSMETGQERELYPEARALGVQYLRWSPDGRSILCGRSLELIDIQTGDVTPILQSGPVVRGANVDAAWSADGKAIFYVKARESSHSIVRHDIETGKEKELWQEGVTGFYGLGISPDGRQLAFVKGNKALVAIAVEGGEPRILHRQKEAKFSPYCPPTWTADGRYVIFGKRPLNILWRVPAEGGEAQRLLTMNRLVNCVSVHPDGRRIAFTGSAGGDKGTWAMDNFLPDPASPATKLPSPPTGNYFVTQSDDDAEEYTDGSFSHVGSSDLDMGQVDRGKERVVGIRFADIRIPKGTRIKKAYLQFTAEHSGKAEPADLTIHAELAASAKAFSETEHNISSRKRTNASVKWSPEPWKVKGQRSEKQRTPDLSSLIQEVIDQPDWQQGNALVLIITGSGERDAMSFDASQRYAPSLDIEY